MGVSGLCVLTLLMSGVSGLCVLTLLMYADVWSVCPNTADVWVCLV